MIVCDMCGKVIPSAAGLNSSALAIGTDPNTGKRRRPIWIYEFQFHIGECAQKFYELEENALRRVAEQLRVSVDSYRESLLDKEKEDAHESTR